MKTVKVVTFIAASLALGDMITRCIVNLSVDTPHINRAIQRGNGLFNRTAAYDPDVVFDVATISLVVTSTVFSGFVIYLIWGTLRALRRSKAFLG